MRIGGYYFADVGYGLKVVEHEAGWSFWLQGDDAQQFRDEWEAYQKRADNDFRHFLSIYSYDGLFK